MKVALCNMKLNKIILYLLIVVFLVLALQYVLAYFELCSSCENKEGLKFKKKFKKPKISAPKISAPTPRVPPPVSTPEVSIKDQTINRQNGEISKLKAENSRKNTEISRLNGVIDNKDDEISEQDEEIETLSYEVNQVQGIGAATQESFSPYN